MNAYINNGRKTLVGHFSTTATSARGELGRRSVIAARLLRRGSPTTRRLAIGEAQESLSIQGEARTTTLFQQTESGMSSEGGQPIASVSDSTGAVKAPRDQQAVLSQLDGRFRISEDTSFAKLVHASLDSGEAFQRWFRYREGFSPELIHRAVGGLKIDATKILDPFSGAGSTLVAARQAGIASVGFEVNPIVALIARAKTHNYSKSDIALIADVVNRIRVVESSAPKAARPGLSILDKVFRPDILDALLASRYLIDGIENERAADFLMTGWLSILEGVSNVFKEGNGVKYRNRKRTKTGYVTIPWTSVPGFEVDGWALVKRRLHHQYELMLQDIEPGTVFPPPEVREESSVSGVSQLDTESVSLAIFSPPYCNNFNYMKIFKVELWMSGMVESYSDIRTIGERALRSHVEMPINVPVSSILPDELHEIVQSIDPSRLWNKKIPKTILAYFVDMRELLVGVYATLQAGGECHIVIGNSAYGGVIIPTDVLLARIAVEIGFEVDRVVVARHLTTSSQQRKSLQELVGFLRESIVVLRKPANA